MSPLSGVFDANQPLAVSRRKIIASNCQIMAVTKKKFIFLHFPLFSSLSHHCDNKNPPPSFLRVANLTSIFTRDIIPHSLASMLRALLRDTPSFCIRLYMADYLVRPLLRESARSLSVAVHFSPLSRRAYFASSLLPDISCLDFSQRHDTLAQSRV